MGAEFPRGTGPKLYIGAIPRCKREAICVVDGTELWPVAYLRSSRDRERLLAALRHLIQPSAWIPGAADCEGPRAPSSAVLRR